MATDYGSFEWPPQGSGSGGSGIASINGDTTSAQLLSIGTAGTDFAIVDAGNGSHVFNLPTASASNRGALSSADWSTFNAKQSALTFGDLTESGSANLTVTGGVGSVIGSGVLLTLTGATLLETTSSVLTITGGTNAVLGTGVSIQVKQSSTSQSGYLSNTDWNTFNGKGSGTVTAVSVASANGFTGSSSGGATPALTLTTSINSPVLSGNGTALVAATTTGSGSTVVLATGPTMTNPVVGTQSQGDGSTKAASTSYVDVAIANAIAGVNPAVAVQAATTSAGNTSGFTYNNGASGIGATLTGAVNTALTVDGFTFTALGQRLLVKNDTQSPSGAFNGVYYVTQVQTAILPPILTRALDYDQPSDMNNTGAIPVINGTVNGTTQWVLTSLVVTVGTTPLTFTQFSQNPANYLLVANNLSDVASKTTSFNNLSPMTTGGDLIYGGASGTGTRLANGSAGQVLTSGGTTVAPSWTTVGSVGVTTLDSGYTPLALWGTCSNISVWYKKIGDEMHVRGTWKIGTATATGMAILLPGSNLIDSSKMTSVTNVQQVGYATLLPGGGNRSPFSDANGDLIIFYDGSTTDRVFLSNVATTGAFTHTTAGSITSTNDTMCFDFWVPIV